MISHDLKIRMSLRGCNHPKQSRALLDSGPPRISEYRNARGDEIKVRTTDYHLIKMISLM